LRGASDAFIASRSVRSFINYSLQQQQQQRGAALWRCAVKMHTSSTNSDAHPFSMGRSIVMAKF